MRFLCLHGLGGNSKLFEAQLAPVLAHLGPEHEFVYVNGPIDCEPPPGIDDLFPPPYCSYFYAPTCGALRRACEWVEQVVEDEGPFDGVIGYSQGAGLAATAILRRRRLDPEAPDLFKLAVLVCGFRPLNPEADSIEEALPYSIEIGKDYYFFFDPATAEMGVRVWDLSPEFGRAVTAAGYGMMGGCYVSPLPTDDGLPGVYRPRQGVPPPISIATVHLVGERDFMLEQCRDLAALCDDAIVVSFDGVHELPRDAVFSKKAADAISAAVFRVQYGC